MSNNQLSNENKEKKNDNGFKLSNRFSAHMSSFNKDKQARTNKGGTNLYKSISKTGVAEVLKAAKVTVRCTILLAVICGC